MTHRYSETMRWQLLERIRVRGDLAVQLAVASVPGGTYVDFSRVRVWENAIHPAIHGGVRGDNPFFVRGVGLVRSDLRERTGK